MPKNLPEMTDEAGACAIIGGRDHPISKSTLRRGIKDGRYPPPLWISPLLRRWRTAELLAVVEHAPTDPQGFRQFETHPET